MPTATRDEASLENSRVSPIAYEDDREDGPEFDAATGDYATRMEEVLGGSDGEGEEEEEDFLYQGQDSQEVSGTYNEQLQDFLEGLDDEAAPANGDVEEEQQVEEELKETDAFVYGEPPRVRA
jgi:hypothetical protein